MRSASIIAGSMNRAPAAQGSAVARWLLIMAAIGVMTVLIGIPVVNVFFNAIAPGVREYWRTQEPATGSWLGAVLQGFSSYWNSLVMDRDTRHSILLTLTVAPSAVVLNVIFGLMAAWAIAHFKFPGRTLLTSLIDLPFAVSPVVAGLSLVLIFGLQGYLGGWLREHDIKIMFATPGLILATTFVTLPFVARELIPLMESLGSEEETAAVSLGASGWQVFWRVTLPNVKWALLYGIILCNARAMGEFGAVYVVSGHIAGQTDTMPLRVEKLFQEYNLPGSYAVASVLTLLALVTLGAKTAVERITRRQLEEAARNDPQLSGPPGDPRPESAAAA
jgi:sulfate/thiosulfate transport system permease protein